VHKGAPWRLGMRVWAFWITVAVRSAAAQASRALASYLRALHPHLREMLLVVHLEISGAPPARLRPSGRYALFPAPVYDVHRGGHAGRRGLVSRYALPTTACSQPRQPGDSQAQKRPPCKPTPHCATPEAPHHATPEAQRLKRNA